MKKTIILYLLANVLLMSACGRRKIESKNMEQIQKEEGIPVRVSEIQPTSFSQIHTYNATLSGIEESVVRSMVGDVVLRINVKVGDYVRKDQVVMTFPTDTPAAQYLQASTAYQNAKATYERMQRIFAEHAISQQDMDNVTTAYQVAEANYKTAQSMVYVKSPISGFVTNIAVNQGEQVSPGADLFTVSNTSKYKAVIWIPDSEIRDLRKGQVATANWNGAELKGYVSNIALAMDQNNKAFRAEVIFTTKTGLIASGITVEIGIETLNKPDVIVVERSALFETGAKQNAWIMVNNKAVKKEVKTGHNNGIAYEITEGLNPGDILITEGLTMIYEGALLKVIQ